MAIQARSLIGSGATGRIIDIECFVSNNLPTIIIVGFAGKAVHEAKDRLRGAFMNSQLELPRRRVTINLAPADVPKSDAGLDLAMASSILVATQQVMPFSDQEAVLGELSLDGGVRPIRGIIGKLLSAKAAGITRFYIPSANMAQAQLVPGICLYPVTSLGELFFHLSGKTSIAAVTTGAGIFSQQLVPKPGATIGLRDIVGQAQAKRALIIAAAGGHNLLLTGPPGTGKSMLAQAMVSLLPPLSYEEILEVTQLHSLANNNYEELVTERPLRRPHHSASQAAMIGGSGGLRPGEISLSHRGVLLLDEFPEFNRPTLEALRQPLEDRIIQVSRARETITFPAHFSLLATANPCPCGYYGSERSCICPAAQLSRYRSKLSGPVLDRIDLCCSVHSVQHSSLLARSEAANDEAAADQVQRARRSQAERYASSHKLNADLTNAELKCHARLDASSTAMLNTAAASLQLSARAYIRVVRVARTIADLADCKNVHAEHLREALAYRQAAPV